MPLRKRAKTNPPPAEPGFAPPGSGQPGLPDAARLGGKRQWQGSEQMSQPNPDAPTDPRASQVEDNTTIVNPGYGPPPGSPAAPFSSPLAPPTIPAPPGPVGSPVPPVEDARPNPPDTEPQPFGRVYGESRPEPEPAAPGEAAPVPELAGRGKTTVTDAVVERVIKKIVDLTVAEVAGVHGLYTGEDAEQPVAVKLEEEQATIDIAVQVEFGHAVHEVVEKVRASVISQTEQLLGLKVTEVNVLVGDVTFDPDAE